MAPKPQKSSKPKPVKKFRLGAYAFEIQEAGANRQPLLGLYIGDGTNSRYCVWFSKWVDHLLMYDKGLKYTMFSGLSGVTYVKPTIYEVQFPITIDEFVPVPNRTQIGIAKQMNDSFFVRFIMEPDNDYPNQNWDSFFVEYPGVAPDELLNKVFWGRLHVTGDTPASAAGVGLKF